MQAALVSPWVAMARVSLWAAVLPPARGGLTSTRHREPPFPRAHSSKTPPPMTCQAPLLFSNLRQTMLSMLPFHNLLFSSSSSLQSSNEKRPQKGRKAVVDLKKVRSEDNLKLSPKQTFLRIPKEVFQAESLYAFLMCSLVSSKLNLLYKFPQTYQSFLLSLAGKKVF